MTKLLKLDEMLDVAQGIGLVTFDGYRASIEAIASSLATEIARELDIDCGKATFEGTAFAGTCAPFYPKIAGQECPAPIDAFDPYEPFLTEAEEAEEMRSLRKAVGDQ